MLFNLKPVVSHGLVTERHGPSVHHGRVESMSRPDTRPSTDGTLIRADEGPKVLASPPIAFISQANF